MAYNPRDFYFKKAKERDFAARSVFKLEEIDGRFRILRKGDKILDLGCAPGSWSQYASKAVGPGGAIVGIDLQKVALTLPNVMFVQGDAFDEATVSKVAADAGIAAFDVVMSDMAPKTTGIRVTDQQRSYDLCRRALDVAERRLKPGGNFVVKLFQSGSFEDYLKTVRARFERVEILRPKSTRKASFEIFIIGIKKRA
ncbi:MAG: RlmE family RNA methyltransferase [Deltaproteobacteria bacterium]|nr:RlmE family RNA methyltransferase [Deltaproteobacteria bacterium]